MPCVHHIFGKFKEIQLILHTGLQVKWSCILTNSDGFLVGESLHGIGCDIILHSG